MCKKVRKCDHKEYDRSLTEQFIHGPHDEGMISKILRQVHLSPHIVSSD